eukprot:gene6447-13022_t
MKAQDMEEAITAKTGNSNKERKHPWPTADPLEDSADEIRWKMKNTGQLEQDNGRPAAALNKNYVDQSRQRLRRGAAEHVGTTEGRIEYPERETSDAMVAKQDGANLLEVGAVTLTTLESGAQVGKKTTVPDSLAAVGKPDVTTVLSNQLYN